MHPVPSFADLELHQSIQEALATQGYAEPTPIQAQAIPPLLGGRDLLGCAQTGTGKTAAFAVPILDRLARQPRSAEHRGPRALVLTPTRELALQVCESFATYGANLRLRYTSIFGGVGQQPQVAALRRGVDVVVATPGRLLDLMDQGHVAFAGLQILVLDEADRMLDMGFIRPIRQILGTLPRKRQNMLFSATMPREIAELAGTLLHNPLHVSVDPVGTPAERVVQSVYFVAKDRKRALLSDILRAPEMRRVIVFTRTKHGANRVADHLNRQNLKAEAIHGNKSQSARQRALAGFGRGAVRVLVATDIAARGLDIDEVSHVINFELPHEPESYVHRIGRTGRAGAAGIALSFCDGEERVSLRLIERLIGNKLAVLPAGDHAGPETEPEQATSPRPSGPRPHSGNRRFGQRGPGRGRRH